MERQFGKEYMYCLLVKISVNTMVTQSTEDIQLVETGHIRECENLKFIVPSYMKKLI